jgi:hypothetical protein
MAVRSAAGGGRLTTHNVVGHRFSKGDRQTGTYFRQMSEFTCRKVLVGEIHLASRLIRVDGNGSPVSSNVFRLERSAGQPLLTMVAAVLSGSKSS